MWWRRILAVVLALIFITVFIPFMVAFRTNDTIGNPHFYTQQLRQADAYNFVYNEVLPSAVNDAYSDMADTSPIDISVLKPYTASIIEQTVPREWLQTRVEESLNIVLPYTLGDSSSFQVRIPLKDRAEAGIQAVQNTLNQPEVSSSLYNQVVNLILEDESSYPADFPLTQEQMDTLLTTALPESWVLQQINAAIDAAAPYFISGQESFTVSLDIAGQMDEMESAANEIFDDSDLYNYVLENMLVPALSQNLHKVTLQSQQYTLTEAELTEAVKEIFPLEWYQSHITDITGPIFAYLKGTDSTLSIALSTEDRQSVAEDVIANLVQKKTGSSLNSATLSAAKQLASKIMPDQLVIDDSFLGDSWQQYLTHSRENISQGFTFTNADLEAILGTNSDSLSNIRQYLSSGITFTETDLRNLIAESGGGNSLQSFDQFRETIGTLRRWEFVAWLFLALLLVAIGALGARQWTDKLIWGTSVLAIASLFTFLVFGPLFSILGQPQINQALAQLTSGTQGIESLIMGKISTLTQNSIHSFIEGLNLQVLILLGVSLLSIAFGIIWPRIRIKTHSSKPMPDFS